MLCLLLVTAMLLGFAVPVGAAEADAAKLSFQKTEGTSLSMLQDSAVQEEAQTEYAATDLVRAAIQLEQPATLAAGYSTQGIAANQAAMAYRQNLREQQAQATAAIESAIGMRLDVVRTLTLAGNVLSVNVPYGQLPRIAQVPGVQRVELECRYDPAVVEQEETAEPNMTRFVAAGWQQPGLGRRLYRRGDADCRDRYRYRHRSPVL